MLEFSRHYCLAICAVIIPGNLLLTLRTLLLAIIRGSKSQLIINACLGVVLAFTLLLHVFSWFTIGVVMSSSYILLGLACLCLAINLGAIAQTQWSIFQFQPISFTGVKIDTTLIRAIAKITGIKS